MLTDNEKKQLRQACDCAVRQSPDALAAAKVLEHILCKIADMCGEYEARYAKATPNPDDRVVYGSPCDE